MVLLTPFFGLEGTETARTVAALLLVTVAAVTDLREGRIPNALTLTAAGVGLVLGVLTGAIQTAVLAGLAGGGALFAVRLLGHALYRQPGMGWGDVKLAGALGTIIGWPVLWALFLAAVVGSVVGLGLRLRPRDARGHNGKPRPMQIVFAPFIAVGWALSIAVPPFGVT
ncbi:MAG: A24 family peptidase [Bacteroidota bacterium]